MSSFVMRHKWLVRGCELKIVDEISHAWIKTQESCWFSPLHLDEHLVMIDNLAQVGGLISSCWLSTI